MKAQEATTTKPRLPRFERAKDPLPMVLTWRDREIVKAIHSFRLLTRSQIEALLFRPDKGQDHPTKTSRCRLRLKLLYHHGFLERALTAVQPGPAHGDFVYCLDRRGIEPGFSARSDQRPEFQNMIAEAKSGRFDVILVHKLDRFSRSVVDVLRYAKIFGDSGIAWVCIADQFDFTTPSGKLMLTMLATLAERYLDNLSREIKKGKRERVMQGLWNGDPPFGSCRGLCKNCEDPNGKGYCPNYGGPNIGDGRHLVHHPRDSQGVLLAFQLHASGEYSDAGVAQALNEAGYRTNRKWAKKPNAKDKGGPGPFTKDTVCRMLQNHFYIGLVSYKGELFPGAHEPLISQKLWDRSQTVRRLMRNVPRTKKRPAGVYPLAGILHCDQCGGKMWGMLTKRGPYYRNVTRLQTGQCSQPMVKAKLLEGQVREVVRTISLSEEIKATV